MGPSLPVEVESVFKDGTLNISIFVRFCHSLLSTYCKRVFVLFSFVCVATHKQVAPSCAIPCCVHS